MDPFDKAFAHVFGIEGGFSDNKADRGGATRYGITEAVARAHGYTGKMHDLPESLAAEIYRKSYWDVNRLGDIARLSYPIALEIFDTGVNMGVGRAAKFLQRALNVFNRGGRDYADIAVDGQVGPATLAALSAFLRLRGKLGETVMLRALNALQGERYIAIAEGDRTQKTFVFGWYANRVGGDYGMA